MDLEDFVQKNLYWIQWKTFTFRDKHTIIHNPLLSDATIHRIGWSRDKNKDPIVSLNSLCFFETIHIDSTVIPRVKELSETGWKKLWELGVFEEDFWEAHYQTHLDWNLSRNWNLPLSFWKRHPDRIVWCELIQSPAIPFPFLLEHLDSLQPPYIGSNPNTPISYIEAHRDVLNKHRLSRHPMYLEESLLLEGSEVGIVVTNWGKQFYARINLPYLYEINCLPPKAYPKPVFSTFEGIFYTESMKSFYLLSKN